MSSNKIFVSVQLNSNQPEKIKTFLENLERTSENPGCVEVLINIDLGDTKMKRVLDEEKKSRKLSIKYIETDLVNGFFDLWKPLNELWKITSPEAYFVINVSDEFIFLTHGWDKILREYEGYYPDHIFRLRASQFRFRNYHDVWECGFAPDSLAFYTRRWLEIVGDWNPCFGPDSFQQCTAFYLFTSDPFSKEQYYRDIQLLELKFSGEGASLGLDPEASKSRVRGHVRTWFILMSHRMQEEAKRRAMLLKANIIKSEKGLDNVNIITDREAKKIRVIDPVTGELTNILPYKLSKAKIVLNNQFRKLLWHYYAGGGKHAAIKTYFKGFLFYLWARYDWFSALVEKHRKIERKINASQKLIAVPLRFIFRPLVLTSYYIEMFTTNPRGGMIRAKKKLRKIFADKNNS